MRITLVIGVMLCLTALCQSTRAQTALVEGSIKAIDATPQFASDGRSLQWLFTYEEPGSKYLRLQFESIADGTDKDYTILIKNRQGRNVEIYPKREFGSK